MSCRILGSRLSYLQQENDMSFISIGVWGDDLYIKLYLRTYIMSVLRCQISNCVFHSSRFLHLDQFLLELTTSSLFCT